MKKIILITVATLMLAVICYGFYRKNNNNQSDIKIEKNKDSKNSSEEKIKYKTFDELDRYKIGEEISVGGLLPNESGELEESTLTYIVNDMYFVDKINDIPSNLIDDVYGIDSEGRPLNGSEILAVNVTIKNNSDSKVTTYLTSFNCYKGGYCSVEYLTYYSDSELFENSKYDDVTIEPKSEYTTILYLLINKEDLNEEVYLLINPNGVTKDFIDAAIVDEDISKLSK